ncbi:hypothetical protein [Streptomyces sp. NPDC021020]|uniref:hypothetical protein n=1 Tax=Streptomyces sp. NPDC021020 TaxID=3365109 RepID=UPI0037AE6827
MLRREGDGVRHWQEQRAMRGWEVFPPHTAATWLMPGDPASVAPRVREVVDAFEREAFLGPLGVHRSGTNVYFDWQHDSGRWTQERYDRHLARLAEPDADGAELAWNLADEERPADDRTNWHISLSVKAVEPDNRWWEWRLKEEAPPFAGAYLDAMADACLRVLTLAGSWPEVTWGAVLRDHFGATDDPPYEQYFALTTPAPRTALVTRGYYWANLLTSGHTDAYGGAEALRSRCEAAGARLDPVPGRTDAVIVRSPLPLSGLDDAQLALLREALAPVTPVVPYRYYAGPPLRVLKEPGTAFRRIPPEIDFPWFEDDGELTPDMGTARQLVPDEDERGRTR